MKKRLVKVCGLTSCQDLAFCQDIGVDLTGFIFHPPSPRYIDPVVVGRWEKKTELRVGVFVHSDIEKIIDTIETARLDLVQLHGGQDEKVCLSIGPERVMRVFWPERHVMKDDFEQELDSFKEVCSFYLLDAGTSSGGHGRSIASPWLWDLITAKPWFLAGGLSPDNIKGVLDLGMTGLDLNSGVELSPGIKDHDKIRRIMKIIFDM
ncbi:phosphoribosylanthranilate isomerase [Desulfonatronovibrio magnus]|uniref:phosphoribosylanthranilate isomerase n=1 Tax=Desulfonatronovibrio magnus TaxID=698827 RepID=UPI0005EB74B4|nr:phosphoribosylanthranilate isomerase [Desulfonatronovibrio magnus]